MANHTEFPEIVDDAGLTQLVEEPTHCAGNTLDLMLTSRPRHINRTEILPGISDHAAVYVELEAKPIRRTQKPRLVPIYSKADWPSLKNHANKLAAEISAAVLWGRVFASVFLTSSVLAWAYAVWSPLSTTSLLAPAS